MCRLIRWYLHVTLLLFAGLLASAWALPALAQQMQFTAGSKPNEQIAPNAAYGSVRFTLELFVNNRPSTRSVFDALLNGLGGLMKEEGNYTLAVELLGPGDEVLSRRGIVSVEKRSSGWFIFNRIVKENETTEWYGELISNVLLRPDTNNIRVRVRSYFSKQSKLDLATFNLLFDVVAKSKLLGAANTALDATWKPLATQIEGLISTYQQSDVSDIATLSFVRFNAEPNPTSGTFVRQYQASREDGTPEKIRVQVRVLTDRTTARVATLTNGKVTGLTSYGDVLAAARIGDQPIDLILTTSKTESVKKLFSDLNSTAGYPGDDIGEKCDRAYDELARHFTVTDKVISYWALLHLYRRKIATNKNARDCLSVQVKKQMEGVGLPLSDLPFARGDEVAIARAPQLESVGRSELQSTIDRKVADRETVEKLLRLKNTVQTFQVFPFLKSAD